MFISARKRALLALATATIAGLGGAPAHASTSTTTVSVVSAAGEIHFCKGIFLSAVAGEYTVTRTVTEDSPGVLHVNGTAIISTPVQLLGTDGVTYTISDQGPGSSFDLYATTGYPTGTVANSWAFDSGSKAGFGKGIRKTSTRLNADGTQVTADTGSCGQEPVTARTSATSKRSAAVDRPNWLARVLADVR